MAEAIIESRSEKEKELDNGTDGDREKAVEDYMNDEDDEKHDEDEDGDKSKDSQLNTLIKLKGIPKCDSAAKYNNFLYKLFVEELKINPPSYRLPRSRDKWIYLDVHTQEDKKKVLDTIGEKYTFEGRELTVKPIWLRDNSKTEVEEKRVLDEEAALDVLLRYRKMTYPQQLKKKAEEADEMIQGIVTSLKATNTKFSKSLDRFPKLSEMIPMLPIDGYANDCTFTVEQDLETKKAKVGIRVSDKSLPYVVPIEKCRQVPRPVIEAVQDFIDHLEDYGLKPYNRETLEGNIMGIFCQMNTACEIIMSILIPKEKIIYRDFTQVTPPQAEEVEKIREDGKSDKETEFNNEETKEEDVKKESDDEKKTEEPQMDIDGKNSPEEKNAELSEQQTEHFKEDIKEEGETKKPEDHDLKDNEDVRKSSEIADDKEESNAKALQELEDEVAEARLLQEEDDEEINVTTKNSDLKEIKAGVIKYFNERGKDFGIVAFYSNWTFYSKPNEWYDRAPYYNYIVGKVTLKESMNGVQFDMSPYRQWSPRTAAHLQILSLIERLAQFDTNTVVGICSEMRFLEVYFAKKCKAVVSVHAWNAKRTNVNTKWAIKRGFRNIEFVSSKQGNLQFLEKTSLSRNVPKVAVVWTGTKPSVMKKFYDVGCRQIILVTTTHRTKFHDMAKHLEFVGSHMAASKIFGVDTHPHGHTYTLVALVEEVAGAGKRRHSDGPLGLGAKRRSLQPLMDGPSSVRRPWDNGPPAVPPQSQGDQWSTAISQMTGFMQNQLIFNEMMKQGIQQMFPNKGNDQRSSNNWGDSSDMRRQSRSGDSRYGNNGGGYGQRGAGGSGGSRASARDSQNYKRKRSNMRNSRGGV
ncbi:uncharacterized protein isoform X3 [Rhodnius prolixus]|uniref:uncharacterized protein isoform X3 n=1 Tax=Rhodnius prolixus TaxID=13249 RepID=UPI003D18C708